MAGLTEEEQRLDRHHVEIDMTRFADAVEQGDWAGQDQFLRNEASKIRKLASDVGEAAIHYYGLAEVAHIVALGAHMGDERAVEFHDHNRDTGEWRWPSNSNSIELVSIGNENLNSVVKAEGAVIMRVAISAAITDSDVRQVVGEVNLADVTITHKDPANSSVTKIRSAADVETFRQEFRRVFAQVRNMRPNLDVIHLFVAGPPSICFAVGQELTLRNSPPIQLYRYRHSADRASQQAAILLTATGEERVETPLTDEELAAAAQIRTVVWPQALADLKNYVANKKRDNGTSGPWYSTFQPQEIRDAAPFPDLPPLARFIPENASVDPEPSYLDYGFERNTEKWKLGDRFLLGFQRAVHNDPERLRQLIRLFLFHEYVHQFHCITKNNAEEVGKFANCLEHLDYTADTYAVLHQLDLCRYQDSALLDDPKKTRQFLADQVELAINSFWAFEDGEWQVRRLRRYLNWYWRLVQLEHCTDLIDAALLFRRQPHIEIGGLDQIARGRRVIARLDRLDEFTHLELGVVLENEKLLRVTESPSINIRSLLKAFLAGHHDEIRQFFRTVYEQAENLQGAQPSALTRAAFAPNHQQKG